MKDRVPLYPGRVKLTPVSGQANTYDMVRADSPTQAGTPLNKASLLKDATAALFGLGAEAVPDDLLSVLSKSVLAQVSAKYTRHVGTNADRPVGSTMALNVGGKPYEFLVVQQGKPSSMYDDSCNGTWLLMKDCYSQRVWDAGNSNIYETSDVDAWLSNDFVGLFDNSVQSLIKQVKIPYRQNGGNGTDQSGANGLSRKVFLLSGPEVGFAGADYMPNNGAKLDYFNANTGKDSKRIAYLNGSAVYWWLRSPYDGDTSAVRQVGTNGNLGYFNASNSYGVRPCIILPSDGEYVYYTDADGNVYTEQEVETQLTDVLGNLIQIPASQIKDGVKLETGSYTGTGTYGSSNPNSLTFGFVPKLVIVYPQSLNGADKISTQSFWVIFTQFTILRSTSNSNMIGASCDAPLSWGNTLTWWTRSSGSDAANNQGNMLNQVYQYIAIG